MKNLPRTLFVLIPFLIITSILTAQSPAIQWQKTIGSNIWDYLFSGIPTTDGGYLLGGFTSGGISGLKTEPGFGELDYWIVKVDATGSIEWQKTFGGSFTDALITVIQTSDGGYMIGGNSDSNISGNKTENNFGSLDLWIIKIDTAGNIEWQKQYGGTSEDYFRAIHQTPDGGYIIGAQSASPVSGNKTEKSLKGGYDYWVIKIDGTGNIIWQNDIGGTSTDFLEDLNLTTDGGYIVSGSSSSMHGGDKSEDAVGSDDFWILKLNSSGNIVWQNTIGGTAYDHGYSIMQTADGGYIALGESGSDVSGDKTEGNYGITDYWVLKLNSSGVIQWQNTIGSDSYEYANKILETTDGGYLIAGSSESGISADKSEPHFGGRDAWLVKLNHTGSINWENTLGGIGDDWLMDVYITPEDGYFLSCYSSSNISDDKSENSYGFEDYWILKMAPEGCFPEVCNGNDDDCNGLIDDGLSVTVSISAGGATTFCQGTSVLLTAVGSEPNYRWKKNGVNIAGATSSTYSATASGNYSCESYNACVSATSTVIPVTVNKNPTATITAGGPTTFCAGGSVVLSANTGGGLSYQWYKGVSPQAGATSPNYMATLNGNYKCKVTKNATGCFKFSNIIPVSVPCRDNGSLPENISFSIYPNPANNFITIVINDEIVSNARVVILDIDGKIVAQHEMNNSEKTLDISLLPSGMYFLQFISNDNIETQKFIKQ